MNTLYNMSMRFHEPSGRFSVWTGGAMADCPGTTDGMVYSNLLRQVAARTGAELDAAAKRLAKLTGLRDLPKAPPTTARKQVFTSACTNASSREVFPDRSVHTEFCIRVVKRDRCNEYLVSLGLAGKEDLSAVNASAKPKGLLPPKCCTSCKEYFAEVKRRQAVARRRSRLQLDAHRPRRILAFLNSAERSVFSNPSKTKDDLERAIRLFSETYLT